MNVVEDSSLYNDNNSKPDDGPPLAVPEFYIDWVDVPCNFEVSVEDYPLLQSMIKSKNLQQQHQQGLSRGKEVA